MSEITSKSTGAWFLHAAYLYLPGIAVVRSLGMAKYSPGARLTRAQSSELFVEFCRYLAELRTPTEVAQAFGDLLSKQELGMVTKRLKIALLLMGGLTYAQIGSRLRTSSSTIARVNLWLQESGEGFRLLYERGRKYRTKPKPLTAFQHEWRQVRRKYPQYLWPSVILEEIVQQANVRQRTKILSVLMKLERRGKLTRELESLRGMLKVGSV